MTVKNNIKMTTREFNEITFDTFVGTLDARGFLREQP